jgi:hypothetical protein
MPWHLYLLLYLFWLGLRWEQDMNTPRGNRMVVINFIVIGLSFGVHFMALLTIPAIGFLYFFKNYKKVTVKNFVLLQILLLLPFCYLFSNCLLPYTMAFLEKLRFLW